MSIRQHIRRSPTRTSAANAGDKAPPAQGRPTVKDTIAMLAEEVLYRLTLIGRASIADYMQLDKTGQPTIAFDRATPAQMYALNVCSVDDIETKRGSGKRTKIKLTDRISALKLLGMQHGMFKTETTLNGARPIPVVLSQAEQKL